MAACNSKSQNEEKSRNPLLGSSSPYLRQHADNPVNWLEWGESALERAKEENKPIIISVGYSACHWCHVMEEESFMDSTVAKIMNEGFISIKVDREERPDVDKTYMEAAQILNGSAGWPLNVFALPDGRPFFAGTYFTVDQWKRLLVEIKEIYSNDHENLTRQAQVLLQGLKEENAVSQDQPQLTFEMSDYTQAFESFNELIDHEFGGINGEQKFPMPAVWESLLQHHYLTQATSSINAVNTTLNRMATGGIYDQLGGGFSRYTTDSQWKVPHFEKMLYDNAQLTSLYAHASQLTQNELYAKTIRETLAFVEREMTSNENGFFSSLNADSQGEEGDFYVWTTHEIEETLGKEKAELVIKYYGISEAGNWENGKNILSAPNDLQGFAKNHQLSLTAVRNELASSKKLLFNKRQERERPSLDTKILTSWNALMLKGYINAYQALGDKRYLDIALNNAQFILDNMCRKDGGLWRSYFKGQLSVEGFMDDYAFLIEAFTELYQATFDKKWLDKAKDLADYALAHFYDPKAGLFYYSPSTDQSLILRHYEVFDNEMPSSNSVMALNLYKLGLFFYDQEYTEIAKKMLSTVRNEYPAVSPFDANWLRLMGFMASNPFEVAIMGNEAWEKTQQMQKRYLPTSVFSGGTEENIPLLEMKKVEGETLIYVCRNKTCRLPVTKVEAALKQINPL
ncbi:thioredoxin domain-containing protein [Echinicola sediminis]